MIIDFPRGQVPAPLRSLAYIKIKNEFAVPFDQVKLTRRLGLIKHKSKNITEIMLKFREAIRHSWNTYFLGANEIMGPYIEEARSAVEQGFFQGIVLNYYGLDKYPTPQYRTTLPFIHIIPSPLLTDFDIQVGEQKDGYFAWGSPVRIAVEKNIELEFIEFFDWDQFEQMNLSLVKVHIKRMDARPDLVGSYALLEQNKVLFFLVEQ